MTNWLWSANLQFGDDALSFVSKSRFARKIFFITVFLVRCVARRGFMDEHVMVACSNLITNSRLFLENCDERSIDVCSRLLGMVEVIVFRSPRLRRCSRDARFPGRQAQPSSAVPGISTKLLRAKRHRRRLHSNGCAASSRNGAAPANGPAAGESRCTQLRRHRTKRGFWRELLEGSCAIGRDTELQTTNRSFSTGNHHDRSDGLGAFYRCRPSLSDIRLDGSKDDRVGVGFQKVTLTLKLAGMTRNRSDVVVVIGKTVR